MKLKVNLDFQCKADPKLQKSVNRLLSKFNKECVLLFKKSQLQEVELSLVICSNQKIRALNKQYRKKDKTTDVLSFPLYNSIKELKKLSYADLGDIYIALPVTKRQARELNLPLENEIIFLLIHGLLHLIGYDHERSLKDEKIMFDLEFKIAKKILNFT